MREILRCCYEHYGLNPDTNIQEDPQDIHADRSVLPEELRPLPPPSDSPASRLMPDVRRRLRSYDDESCESDAEEGAEVTAKRPPSKKQKHYNPFSQEPTPLALRRPRRNK